MGECNTQPGVEVMSEPIDYYRRNPKPYIPATLSEIYDFLASIIGGAPRCVDESGWFPERNIDSVFHALTSSFEVVRKKIGDERYARLMDLAARVKALFLEIPMTIMARPIRASR